MFFFLFTFYQKYKENNVVVFCSPFIRNKKKFTFFFLTPFQKCPHRDVCSARPFECCPRKTTLGTGPCLCPPTPFQAVCAVPGTQEGKTLFLFLRYFWWRKNKNNVIGGYQKSKKKLITSLPSSMCNFWDSKRCPFTVTLGAGVGCLIQIEFWIQFKRLWRHLEL